VHTNGANAGTELVVNGGLEDGRTGWTFLAGARRKCSGFGDGSNCGFRLPPQTRAEQRGMMGPILDTIDTVAGDVLLVSAAVRTKTANKQRVVMVVVNYIDPAAGAGGHGKDKFKLFVQQATTGYVTFTDNFVLDGEIKGGRVVVANMNGSRPLRVDDISVMLISTEARLGEGDTESRSADGLLPVPAAPDAFRGSN
jgi:hypothetical protein